MKIGVREQTQDPDIGQFIQLLKGNKVESLTDDCQYYEKKERKIYPEKWIVIQEMCL